MQIRITCVDCLEPCSPWSDLDFVHFMWTTFAYYFRNHAMVVMPLGTVGNKLPCVCHYKAEIGGDESRACRASVGLE